MHNGAQNDTYIELKMSLIDFWAYKGELILQIIILVCERNSVFLRIRNSDLIRDSQKVIPEWQFQAHEHGLCFLIPRGKSTI